MSSDVCFLLYQGMELRSVSPFAPGRALPFGLRFVILSLVLSPQSSVLRPPVSSSLTFTFPFASRHRSDSQ